MDLLTLLPLLGALLGALTPLLTAVVQQPFWPTRKRQFAAVIVSVFVGLGTVLAANGGDLASLPLTSATLAAVIAASEAAYRKAWQKSGVTDKIEWATTPPLV